MSDQPIYEYIRESIVDGVLPAGFSLDAYDKGDPSVPFADGALDGITMYHMARPELPDDLAQSIGEGIARACEGDYEAADELLGELGNKHRAIVLIDQLQRFVMERSESIPAQALAAYARHLMLESTDKELVKMGLSFQELFSEPGDQMKQVVRTLGLSDEFTIFAAWCAGDWTNVNEELFGFAKRVTGWGRVHVVEMLAPETDEIREWLLYEGAHNYVMPEYSALTCYLKAGVAERLERTMGHDEFSAITFIVAAALGNGPVAGIMALDDPKTELARYVAQAAHQPLDDDDRACLDAIAQIAAENGWGDLAAQ